MSNKDKLTAKQVEFLMYMFEVSDPHKAVELYIAMLKRGGANPEDISFYITNSMKRLLKK